MATTIDGVETLRRTLHERGFRMTPQRQLVLDAVEELQHATPEQICASVQRLAPAVNITTVYRTLDLLERLGLVRHTHLGHGAPNYSVREHEHVHLVCHGCGSVAEVPSGLLDELAGRLDTDYGFRLDATHVALSGTCTNCTAEEATEEATEEVTEHSAEHPAGSDAAPGEQEAHQ
ncbi:MAG: Fur family transcriptional regulator, ferric uptake regulator [Pseudonocardiales bacterium]|jgi:Fur family ferric uptake transcriptional regulator|nr:Fur family transcriptional regulator, ferric uptake regulator [Pseudonocardiales bacterium]MDT7668737.1 Fur family transcriptional regulator, ferric uptake regulator [Pseudonocardiales bacterium]